MKLALLERKKELLAAMKNETLSNEKLKTDCTCWVVRVKRNKKQENPFSTTENQWISLSI